MLDPELLERLAAEPERNAPEVNAALAAEGTATVLLALVRSSAVGAEALRTIAERVRADARALVLSFREAHALHDEEPCDVLDELDRALVAHPEAPASVRDAVLERHPADPFFVLAAASHARATTVALECAARWPARAPVLERLWLALLPAQAVGPLVAEEWAQDHDSFRREAAARLARDPDLLERLSRDPARNVRRAVASNPAASEQRERLAVADPAVEVRARAAAALGDHGGRVALDSARFAAALRAMHEGGTLTADVAGALGSAGPRLDEEGAMWAARLLPRERVVALVEACVERDEASAVGLAVGVGLREPTDDRLGGEEDYRELVVEVAKALSARLERHGGLTGKARLAAWIADGLARTRCLDPAHLIRDLDAGPIASEPLVLGLALRDPTRLAELCAEAVRRERVTPALLELAWSEPAIADDVVLGLARKVSRARPRGRDLPDDEIDLDPHRRGLPVLEEVVLAACRAVTFSPRTALTVVALDSRRVRYVLTAMPAWRGRLTGAMLGRVLKQNAGALAAGPAEARYRGEQMRGWTERLLNDIELAIAFAIGHITVDVLVERVTNGRHRLEDGISLAAAADARAAIAGVEAIRPLLAWSTAQRNLSEGALAAWILLERHDRSRPASMIASAVDALSAKGVASSVIEALGWLERRSPGRIPSIAPQTPRGKATHASAIARAYRAVGGLRDERG
jgi:hypothetical protein